MGNKTRKPSHPGEILRRLYIDPSKMSISQIAKKSGIDREVLIKIVNGYLPVSYEIATMLGKCFRTSRDLWLNLQYNYDSSLRKIVVKKD